MKLTPEELIFIDTYLKNSEIEFIDVRMELVDHVANAVEDRMNEYGQSFYDAFKAYMVQHKRELVKDQERLRKKLQVTSFKQIMMVMVKPFMLVLFVSLLLSLTYFKALFSISFPYFWLVFFGISICLLAYAIGMFPKKRYRFSGLEALGWVMFIPAQVVSQFFNLTNFRTVLFDQFPMITNIVVAMLTCFNIAFLIYFFKIRKAYQLKFENV